VAVAAPQTRSRAGWRVAHDRFPLDTGAAIDSTRLMASPSAPRVASGPLSFQVGRDCRPTLIYAQAAPAPRSRNPES
jgi:hypothetical protein